MHIRSATWWSFAAVVYSVGCGSDELPSFSESEPTRLDRPEGAAPRWRATDHTPGFFRDTYRITEAQAVLTDEIAVERIALELPERIREKGELPLMAPKAEASLEPMLILTLRSVQANADTPSRARHIADDLIERVLRLDPARAAHNRAHGPSANVTESSGGPRFIADSALSALGQTARLSPDACRAESRSPEAEFVPGDPEPVWIPERCEPDRFVGGYCEDDRIVEGECHSEWVDEDCDGGEYERRGRYEYFCRSDDTCSYVWRPRRVYVPGSCTGGYYHERCIPDRFEAGLCYPSTFEPGGCEPARWESRPLDGMWMSMSDGENPECEPILPAQRAIVDTALALLVERFAEYTEPFSFIAARSALATEMSDNVRVDVGMQILRGVVDGGYEP